MVAVPEMMGRRKLVLDSMVDVPAPVGRFWAAHRAPVESATAMT